MEKAAGNGGFFHIRKMIKMRYPLDFYTSYNQFYIADKETGGNTASVDFWTDTAFSDRLAIEDGILGVGIECYGPVKGEVYLLISSNNHENFDEYDHVVEAGIKVKTGTIQILNCPDSKVELEINVEPGSYRARIYSSNLASVDGDEGDDFYKIEVWPDVKMGRKVLKQYQL